MRCEHTADKLFSLQYIEDYRKLSDTVANSVHTTDKTRPDSLVLSVSVVWSKHWSLNRKTIDSTDADCRPVCRRLAALHVHAGLCDGQSRRHWTTTVELMSKPGSSLVHRGSSFLRGSYLDTPRTNSSRPASDAGDDENEDVDNSDSRWARCCWR